MNLKTLLGTLPRRGRVEWIGVRPGRLEPIRQLKSVTASSDSGLEGDRYAGRRGERHVTLIQWEHLAVIASLMGAPGIDPVALRRNIAVSGINLLALKDKRFYAGGALLEYTGQCHPCSLMEQTLGAGGFNAVRGHGGITARVVESGVISVNDPVAVEGST